MTCNPSGDSQVRGKEAEKERAGWRRGTEVSVGVLKPTRCPSSPFCFVLRR